MNTARSAIASATFTDCSTITIVTPVGLEPLDDLEELLHDERREAERQLVDEQQLGLEHHRLRHREHLLLAARQRAGARLHAVPERGEGVERDVDALGAARSGPR